MSSISMEWLGGPLVLNLTQDEIMADLDEDWSPELPLDPEDTTRKPTHGSR